MSPLDAQTVITAVIGLLLAGTVASLVGLERAGLDPALKVRRTVLLITAHVSAFGVALALGALRAVG